MKRWQWIGLIVLGLLGVAAQYVGEHHGKGHWWDKVPAFWALYGLVGSGVLIGVTPVLLKLLHRPEDYYDDL